MRSLLSLFMIFTLSFARTGLADSESVILILGDSLSAAFGMELGDSWPSLLQDRLTEHGHAYRVFNSSITGDTTQSGLARLSRLLAQHQPKLVLIELGGNDGLRGLSLDATQANLQAMIDKSRVIGASVVLAGIKLPPNYGSTYTRKFSNMYLKLAETPNVHLIPFILQDIALDPGMMQEDGIHPTKEAQPVLLDNVWEILKPLVK